MLIYESMSVLVFLGIGPLGGCTMVCLSIHLLNNIELFSGLGSYE